jgi:hypothetical protein
MTNTEIVPFGEITSRKFVIVLLNGFEAKSASVPINSSIRDSFEKLQE